MVMSLKQWKIKFEPKDKIEPQHMHEVQGKGKLGGRTPIRKDGDAHLA